jgi:hypothetical protein
MDQVGCCIGLNRAAAGVTSTANKQTSLMPLSRTRAECTLLAHLLQFSSNLGDAAGPCGDCWFLLGFVAGEWS